ncbi:hypothetical protein RND71_035666 [Anisodus tanguticus]|uniref:DUF4283 domain-containing protein n=1 Tax=Anisodus tanguticus TaxID=243964 RepID=A0AAE1V2E1_9SOLA|nr:hypothetical protein RND71_035666 [Anisodus tanguticus]
MGSAPMVLQPQPSVVSVIPEPSETNPTVAARKLTYSAGTEEKGKSLAEVVRGDQKKNQGMQLKFYQPKVRDGLKVVELNPKELEKQCQNWLMFPELPVHCWAEENLGRIGSYLGKSLCTDRRTAQCQRISYARMLIEMDITQDMPDEMYIEMPDGSIWYQVIDYDWKPKFCQDCNHFGHITGTCRELVKPPEKPQTRKK